MKHSIIVIALLVLATSAFAATQFTNILNLKVKGKTLLGTGTETGNTITNSLGTSATIDFASATIGGSTLISDGGVSTVTVTGAVVGDVCEVDAPAAAAALKANFNCYVTAADTVTVRFTPEDRVRAQVALSSGTPSTATATVSAGSVCTCTPVGATAAIAAAGCATGVSSTTLTLTGPNSVTTTMTYDCAAPVDPASGTFYVRTFSAQ